MRFGQVLIFFVPWYTKTSRAVTLTFCLELTTLFSVDVLIILGHFRLFVKSCSIHSHCAKKMMFLAA